MKIIYTDSGRREMEAFKEEKAKELEAEIRGRKYVFGDEVLEITATDIREANRSLVIERKLGTRRSPVQLLLQVYYLLGILMVIGAFWYGEIKEFVSKDPTRAALAATGIVMALASLAMLQRVRARDRERERLERFGMRSIAWPSSSALSSDSIAEGVSATRGGQVPPRER